MCEKKIVKDKKVQEQQAFGVIYAFFVIVLKYRFC